MQLRRIGDWWVVPDGKQVSMSIERGGGTQDLALVPLRGGALRPLVPGGDNIAYHQWSPDGQRIAYSSARAGSADVWVVDVAGGAPRQLVGWPTTDEFPAVWSADGYRIWFLSTKDAALGDIWTVPLSGGRPIRVTKLESVVGLARTPDFARDGQAVVFRIVRSIQRILTVDVAAIMAAAVKR